MPRSPRLPVTLSTGGWVIVLIALLSSAAVALWPAPQREGIELWTFARNHGQMYMQLGLMAEHDGKPRPLVVSVLDSEALKRRTLSGFWAGTPVADLIEVERNAISNYVTGPLEHIGFTDLTDRLAAEGLDRTINAPSFSPWTSRGRVFGLPHDVHPVLLCYRADLVEAAGIDVREIETWDDFARVMRPLVADLDGDGTTDRYLINLWYTSRTELESLLLQAGGGTFDTQGRMLVDSPANATVLAQAVAWMIGPNRIAIDAPNFSPSGNQLKLDGHVICEIMPDWLAGVYQADLPQLSGKLKLMPLPAWESGGRRTSVAGGTMLGIPKQTQDFETAWEVAKQLYVSPEIAQRLFTSSHIISPVLTLWSEPFYHEPTPYFSGQPSGSLYIEQAPHVPQRSSSPFHQMALNRIFDAAGTLYREASSGRHGAVDSISPELLRPRAEALLSEAAERIDREMSRNVFLAEEGAER
ncbi:MAG: extracellular solute-binding protein [Planctomycetota bacterium]